MGVTFLLLAIPVRILLVAGHRRAALKEPIEKSIRIGVSMLPTLVFALVIAGILRETFALPRYIFGGLIIYTRANTLIPGFSLRLPAIELDVWHHGEESLPPPISQEGKAPSSFGTIPDGVS